MRIAMTGSSGLIGSALMARFEQDGHAVTRVVRGAGVRDPRHRTVVWDPAAGTIDRAGLEAHDAVVHLAGEDIAAGRWTLARKKVIRESRIRGTLLLCETLADLAQKPRVLITASGVGYSAITIRTTEWTKPARAAPGSWPIWSAIGSKPPCPPKRPAFASSIPVSASC